MVRHSSRVYEGKQMKNIHYITIHKNLLDSLEYEEKINSEHKRILNIMFEDLIYNKQFSKYTLEKIKELN